MGFIFYFCFFWMCNVYMCTGIYCVYKGKWLRSSIFPHCSLWALLSHGLLLNTELASSTSLAILLPGARVGWDYGRLTCPFVMWRLRNLNRTRSSNVHGKWFITFMAPDFLFFWKSIHLTYKVLQEYKTLGWLTMVTLVKWTSDLQRFKVSPC